MSRQLPLDGLLFDKDGTLLDFQATWGPATALVARQLARQDEIVYRRIADAIGLDVVSERLHPDSPLVSQCAADYVHLFAEHIGEEASAEFLDRFNMMCDEASIRTFTPIGDPKLLLGSLRAKGYRLGIATNDSHAGARAHSARLGLDDLVEFHVGYDSGHGRKPEPGMVTAFARHIGAPAARVAIIGDSVHDLDSGRAAGARAIAVLSGPARREMLAPHADHVIGSIADLPKLLASLSLVA